MRYTEKVERIAFRFAPEAHSCIARLYEGVPSGRFLWGGIA